MEAIQNIEYSVDKLRLNGQIKKIIELSIKSLKESLEQKQDQINQLKSELIVAKSINFN